MPSDSAVSQSPSDRHVSTRAVQGGVAGLLLALAGVVIIESRRLGAGWTDDGPGAGYFPHLVGWVLAAGSLGMLLEVWRRPARLDAPFVAPQAWQQVAAVLWPACLYVAAVQWLGLYLASGLYIAWFMHRLGRYRWRTGVLVGAAVMGTFYAMFERWFNVPLHKGTLTALLGGAG